MYAAKTAQEAYVESLQRMTVEQLIAEVMRVQIAAAELIKQEVANEREACAKACDDIERRKWEIMTQGGKLEGLSPRDCSQAIRARGEESVKH